MSLGRLNGSAVPAGNTYKMRPQCYIYRLLTHYYYHLLTMGPVCLISRRTVIGLLAIYLCRGNMYNEQKCEHKETVASEGFMVLLCPMDAASINRCLFKRRINGLLCFVSGFIASAPGGSLCGFHAHYFLMVSRKRSKL